MPTNTITSYFNSRKRRSRRSPSQRSKKRRTAAPGIVFQRSKRSKQSRRYFKPYRRRSRGYRRRSRPVSLRSAIKLNDRLQLPQTYTTDFANVKTVPALSSLYGKQCGWLYSAASYAQGAVANSMYSLDDIRTMCTQIWGTATSNFNYKLFINSCERVETLVNAGNSPAHITHYRIVARYNVPVSTLYNNFLNIYSTGLYEKDKTSFGGNASVYSDQDKYSFFDSNKFCSYFKVVASKRFTLDGGQQRHIKTFGGFRAVNTEMLFVPGDSATFDSASSIYNILRGEILNVYKVTGMPAGVTNVANVITYTTPKVQLTCQTKYIYRQHTDVMAKIFNDPATGYHTAGVNNPTFVEDDTGNAVTMANIA